MTRREWLQTVTLAATVPLLRAAEPNRPLFFTADQFALLDALAELIIPTDKHSPGAHAAGVAGYIDRITAESFPGEARDSWTNGLQKVEDAAKQQHNTTFVALQPAQQAAILRDMDARSDPFFGQLKESTAFAYYSSAIGIHEDMGYLGNKILIDFVGYAV